MNASIRRFRALATRHLDETHRLFPHVASERGLHEFDALLGQNDAAMHREYLALTETTLRDIERLPDFAFTGDDWLDRRGLLALLRTERFFYGVFPHWRINPQVHSGTAIDAIFHLVVRHAANLRPARAAIEARLAALPRFLEQGAACLRHPVPLWTELARRSCDGAKSFFEEVGAQLSAISPKPAKTAQLIRHALAALQRYAQVAESKEPGPASGFSVGRENFEFLIRERLGFALNVDEAEAIGHALVDKLSAELKAEGKRFGRGQSIAVILEGAAARWQPRGPLLDEYARVTKETRRQFQQAGFVTFPPQEKCQVLPVPEYLRHQFPTAAYHQPGAFDQDQTGIFWVNDLSLVQPTPEKRAGEIRQHFGLALTCAHEAYPGHHLQFVVQNRHPSKIRRLMHHAIFYEGWTLWCEKQAVDLGIVDFPEARLAQIHDALWRAHRIVIDCGLHSGKLTYATAAKRLQDGVGFTAARARGDVNWYTSSPTVPMSYLLGRLEVERLHAQLVGREGWSLRRFNDWMLSFGALPWSWIWQSRLRPSWRSMRAFLLADDRHPSPAWTRVLGFLLAFLLLAGICAGAFALLDYHWNWQQPASYWRLFLDGFITTLEISALALPLSCTIGLVLTFARRSPLMPLRDFVRIFVELTRGTPLLVQLFIYWYAFGEKLSSDYRLLAGALTLSLFEGAYISEVFRAGIESIGASQWETARAIGFTHGQTYRYVIFPQALRQSLPPLAGQFVSIIKDSSLLSVLGISEFSLAASQVNSITYSTFEIYLPIAVGYLILTLPISLWTQQWEKRSRFET